MEFDWDAANVAHIARHQVTPDEVQQVFANGALVVGPQEHPDEDRFLCFGRTDAGRFLTVVYTERQGRVRAVTAYPMTKAQQRIYFEERW